MPDDDAALTCTPETLRAPAAPASLTLQRVDAFSGPDALRELAAAVTPATGEAAPEPTREQVAAVTAGLRDGLGVLARLGSTPAGGGLFTPGPDGVARIAALGLRDAGDAAGLGPVLAAELARLAFRAGARRVVLEAGAPPAYGAAGFTAVG